MSDPAAAVVRARIDLERRRLGHVNRLRTTGPAADLVQEFAGDRLNAIETDLHAQLDRLEDRAARRIDSKTLDDLAGLQKAVDRAARETLDLAMGALARQAHLDDDACKEADLFVKWLARRVDRRFVRPTLPGNDEAVHRATDIIHRRIPDHGLWDLPVMAHEFGHLVVSGLRTWDVRGDQILSPIESWLENFHDWRRSQATELFCDMFASYTMGPSYLCTQVFHRLNPVADARVSDRDSHPGDPTRVYTCQWTLERMSGRVDVLHPFSRQVRWASLAWESMQSDAPPARMNDKVRAELRTQLAGCWVALTDNLSALRYKSSPAMSDLVSYLESPAPPAIPDFFSPADALNAAWIVRLGGWYEGRSLPDNLEYRARLLVHQSFRGNRHGR